MAQRIVDLTLPLYHGVRGVTTEVHTSLADNGYNTSTYHLYSHAGTHMDAPLHFLDGGSTIDAIPLDRCIGQALVIDLTHIPPNGLIQVADLAPFQDRIRTGSRLLLRTDWSKQIGQEDYRSHMPRISADLARWMVTLQIGLVGVEQPSVASVRPEKRTELTEVHRILLSAGVVIVEGLANLDQLDRETVHFIALPLRMQGGDGSPVRAVAIVNDGA